MLLCGESGDGRSTWGPARSYRVPVRFTADREARSSRGEYAIRTLACTRARCVDCGRGLNQPLDRGNGGLVGRGGGETEEGRDADLRVPQRADELGVHVMWGEES